MNIKKYVAEGIRKIAVKKAYRSVGKSLPLGMHEVEVPKCLKNDTLEKNETDMSENCILVSTKQ